MPCLLGAGAPAVFLRKPTTTGHESTRRVQQARACQFLLFKGWHKLFRKITSTVCQQSLYRRRGWGAPVITARQPPAHY
jgi:hypothetical protein